MTTSPHDDDAYDPPSGPRRLSRAKLVAGLAGLAVLGGGAFLVTEQLTGDTTAVTTDAGAPAPIVASEPDTASPELEPSSAAPSPSTRASKAAVSKAPASPEPVDTRSAEERVKAAREAAAKAGHPVQRALTPEPGAVAAAAVEVTNEGSLKSGGTMRIITARSDLTGQRELLWAADDGKPVGSSRCTQNFHFSNDGKAKERPTMLLCWRTSATRSVATVAVVATGRPDAAASVAVIDQRWATLG